MIRSGLFKTGLFLPSFLSLCLSFSLFSCTFPQPKICIKDGQTYCITSDKAHLITWDACYRRGLSCMDGDCLEYALEEFKQAIDLRYKDKTNVRAFGMHFRDEYFPHREIGICYFRLGRIEDALKELELSISQTTSARAKYYLNQTRRANLLATGRDTASPAIQLAFPVDGYLTNQTPLQIKGVVRDDQFAAAVSINNNPLFIELAKPTVPFTVPVDLVEGWNTIEVAAKDLVDRQGRKSISVYLDRQGPLVFIEPLRENQPADDSGSVNLSALIYDTSGIVSFKLNGREVPRIGTDQLCLVEKTIVLDPNAAFWTRDKAGNITKGKISLRPARRRANPPLQLACANSNHAMPFISALAENQENETIFFNITHPVQKEIKTPYQEIFIEGEIYAQHGIFQIGLNDEVLFNAHEMKDFEERNRQEFLQALEQKNLNPPKYKKMLENLRQRYSIHLNKKISLKEKITTLNLMVEDNRGNKKPEQFIIEKIPREKVFKSEQRMALAIIPFDLEEDNTCPDPQDDIYNKLIKLFVHQGRFNLVEKEALPWNIIERACQTGKICGEDVARQIGKNTSAEGIICGSIRKWKDGIEIKARFREVEEGESPLYHDVFTPLDTSKNREIIISGLAMKFRDSFPVCLGTIEEKKGQNIFVNIGSKKGLFRGMRYNIFEKEKEQYLITKASIRKVWDRASKAKILEKEISGRMEKDYHRKEYRVRTR